MFSTIKQIKKKPTEIKIKQKRAPKANYLPGESELLVECALREKFIIENKKTDFVASKDKLDAWDRISDDYNSVTTGMVRTAASLREKYGKIKAWLRSSQSNAAKKLKKTDGGPFEKESETLSDPLQELSSLLSLSINGRNASVGDCDLLNDDEIEEQSTTESAQIRQINVDLEETILDVNLCDNSNLLITDVIGEQSSSRTAQISKVNVGVDETILYTNLSDDVNATLSAAETEVVSSEFLCHAVGEVHVEAVSKNITSNLRKIDENLPTLVKHQWLKGAPSATRSKIHPLLQNTNKRKRIAIASEEEVKKQKREDEIHQMKQEKLSLEIEMLKIERDHLLMKSKSERERLLIESENARERSAQSKIEFAELHALKLKILQAELTNIK